MSEFSFEKKHPLILPKCHVSKFLVRDQHWIMKQAGVKSIVTPLRSSYWIKDSRRLAKGVKI